MAPASKLRNPADSATVAAMRWYFFLSCCGLAVFNGVFRGGVSLFQWGDPGRAFGDFFGGAVVFLMLGGPFAILADFIAWRRRLKREGRNLQGQAMPGRPLP